MKDAPEDIRNLVEELEGLACILADIEDDQRQHPMSSLVLDAATVSRCVQHCKQGADRLKALAEGLASDIEVSQHCLGRLFDLRW